MSSSEDEVNESEEQSHDEDNNQSTAEADEGAIDDEAEEVGAATLILSHI
jgi:hypothetical protein